MTFKKLNKLQKLALKLRNSDEYKNYKFLHALQNVKHPDFDHPLAEDVHFKHSGNAGDIIYALPAVYALSKGKRIHLHLNINREGVYGKMRHPLGNLMLNEKMVQMLKPLLLSQPFITTCDVYNGQSLDYDLDLFRQYPFNQKTGSISRWYFLTFAVNADLGKPWLKAAPDALVNDAIVIARSQRYRAPGIDYSFLRSYPRTLFVGLEEEYNDMKQMVPSLEFKKVNDFLELASLIAGSRLFIGNQSFPFSVAEGLKVRRLLEVYHLSPNVVVEGPEGYDFCYQPQFENLVHRLYYKESINQ